MCIRDRVQPTEQPQVLTAGEVLVDRGVLAREADDVAQLLRLAYDVVAGDAAGAFVGSEQCAHDADGGGLACTVGAEQAQHGTFGNGKVEPVESSHLALAGAIDLDQAFGFDDRHVSGASC
jgi:hypothetical protein